MATQKPEWTTRGSAILQNEQHLLKTDGGLALVLSRTVQGTWVLSCAQLWSNGQSVVVAASETPPGIARQAAVFAAHDRISELGAALPRAR